MPPSTDTQVTNTEIWRTEGGGTDYFLVTRIGSTETTYTDDVADAEITFEPRDVRRAEDVADEPLSLLDVEQPVVRDDARGVLPAVLDRHQAVVDLVDRAIRPDDTDESAHA